MTLFRVALTDDLDGAQPILKVTTISTASIEPKQVGFLGDLGVMMAGFKSSLHFLLSLTPGWGNRGGRIDAGAGVQARCWRWFPRNG